MILRFLTKFLLVSLWLVVSIPLSSAQDATAEPTPTPLARPLVEAAATNTGLTLERLFPSLAQGEIGVLRLSGANIQEGRVLFRNREYPFFQASGDEWFAFVVADMDAQPRDYALSVVMRTNNGETISFADSITVTSSGYIRQLFEVPPSLGYLIDPAVERGEYARLDTLIQDADRERLWTDNVWALPINTGYNSRFGQYRILNQAVQTRHTGWDQSTPTGTPVGAMMDGIIAFAGALDIRGNYVLVDHGWGIYTGYAHLSEMSVQVGDRVMQGQIIGLSGNTGRSNGPHLHWEVVVNGEWVDGVLFLETWIPS